MSDKDLEIVLREWTQETPAGQPDRSRVVGDVVGRLASTRRRRRRWPVPFLYRASTAAGSPQETTTQPSPSPVTNGQTPTIIGRTTSMLSPTKTLVAGAIVFALGGAFLIAQPFSPSGTDVPAAEGDAVSMEAAWVTGTLLHAPSCTPPERTIEGGVIHEVGYRCESQLWETDDPRLTGRATPSWNADVYRLGPDASVLSTTWEVETDTGGWLCTGSPVVAQGSGLNASTRPATIACAGNDAFDGLTAILDIDIDAGSIEGLVFAGAIPPAPAPASP